MTSSMGQRSQATLFTSSGRDPTHHWAPKFSFGMALPTKHRTPSPGPVYNLNASITRHGPDRSIPCTIGPRPSSDPHSRRSKLQVEGPGPGAYAPENFKRFGHTGASYSLGARADHPRKASPGPGQYSPTLKPVTPAFSFGVRHEGAGFLDLGSRRKTPGPGKYYPLLDKADGTPNSPSYTLGVPPKPSTSPARPGPGSHRPEDCALTHPRSPTYRFGPPSSVSSKHPNTFVMTAPSDRSTPVTGRRARLVDGPPSNAHVTIRPSPASSPSMDAQLSIGSAGEGDTD